MGKEVINQHRQTRIVVFARDYMHYARFVRKFGLQRQCRYVIDESDLKGYEKGTYKVAYFGDWFNNQYYYSSGMREKIESFCANAQEVRKVV